MNDPTVHIQVYLREGHTPEQAAETFKLETPKRHRKYPNLVQFKYDQIASDMSLPLVQQCRGIILDEKRDWMVAARPFDKFFNAEEPRAAAIEWHKAKVLEKLDGSLCILYNYTNHKEFVSEWLVATSGRPDASGNVNDLGMTFEELFWKTFGAMGMEMPGHKDFATDLTFMFELTSPYNRIVVDNGPEPRVTLIGARNRVTGEEFWPEHVVEFFKGWVPVKSFTHHSTLGLGILRAYLEENVNPLKQEGYVVVDHEFRRVKVKHSGYVLAHQLRSSFSTKNALEAIRRGEAPEILAHFPEMKAAMKTIEDALVAFRNRLQDEWLELRLIPPGKEHQKEFALRAVKLTMGGAPHFAMRAGKVGSFTEFLAGVQIDRLVEVLGLKEVPTPTEIAA